MALFESEYLELFFLILSLLAVKVSVLFVTKLVKTNRWLYPAMLFMCMAVVAIPLTLVQVGAISDNLPNLIFVAFNTVYFTYLMYKLGKQQNNDFG